ncbi:cytochrome C551 [Chryseobacterium lathyri]|uniref:cytochrome C551 n=1 Tax=Chryseobacterium TaxID=59732 RepID=UPI001CBAF276|nr:cytochrome C551 [Chryseobacterium lathyri]
MKKFLLAAIGLGIIVVSCGTKESSMSSNIKDSTAVSNTQTVTPSAKDSTKMTTDTAKIKVDSSATVPPSK